MIIIDNEFRDLCPELSDEEFKQLEKNINAEGCRDPLVLWGDVLIDGHNRKNICEKNGVQYQTVGKIFDDREDVKVWIINNQFGRRNLSNWHRSDLALKLEEIFSTKAKENQGKRTDLSQKSVESIDTQKEVAKAAGVSHDTISRVKKIKEKATEEQKENLAKGEVSINEVFKDIKREERKNEVQEKINELRDEKVIIPDNKYHTIVIDPPWEMKKIERDDRPNQVEFDYPTMNEEELKAFDVPSMAHDNCNLYLWTTHKHLPMAFRLAEHWGFQYLCTMVWHKNGGFQPAGLPQYNCEFCLICRKGNLPFLDTKDFKLCFEAPRREHSRKPDMFYERVARVSAAPRIDVFSREKRDGFDQFGNEVEKFSE